MQRRLDRIEKEFSADFSIYTICTHELKLATLNELQTVYDTEDAMLMLEMIEVYNELVEISRARGDK